jgi:hypothetical protein
MDIAKFRQILFNVSDEIIDKLDEYDKKADIIAPKVRVLQDKLANHLKDKCYDLFEWLEKNGLVEENDRDFAIRINKHQANKATAETTFVQFHECCSKNDHGIRNYFKKIQIDLDNLKVKHSECLNSCRAQKDENKVRTCVKDCFVNAIGNMTQMNENVSKYLEELNKKL